MIRIAVVDDVPEICTQVENDIINISKEQGVLIDTEVYYKADQLCNHLNNGEFFDLIFMDIEMDEFSGIDASNMIRNVMKNEATQIAYISGNKEYAIEIFEYDPLYFLHKPLTREKIEKVFLKLIKKLHLKVDAFSYKVGHNTVKVAIRDIIYFESCDHKIKIHFYVQNTYKKDEFYGNMDHVQQQLGSFQFLRIHKAFLVNPLHVKRYSYDELYMSIGVILPIAQSKRKEIRAAQFLL